jgi:hypothetical protein
MWPVCKLKGGGNGGQGGVPGGHVIGDVALGDDARMRQGNEGMCSGVVRARARALARAQTFMRIHAEIKSVHTAHKCLGASGFLDHARASTSAPWTLMRKQYCMLLLLSAPRVKRSEILHK